MAVFAPTRLDPEGSYSVKFVGGDWRSGVKIRSRFWMYEHVEQLGYGSTNIGIQTCRTLADPPDKDCPELANWWGSDRRYWCETRYLVVIAIRSLERPHL
jgi:hypothetical protein